MVYAVLFAEHRGPCAKLASFFSGHLAMKARIQWAGEALFIGESGSGHAVVMDGPPEAGGRNLGVRPMEMLLIGLGGCSNYDVVSILK